MDADPDRALQEYRKALETLAGIPVPARSGPWVGEADLALRRLYRLAETTGEFSSAGPVLERWMEKEAAGDANLAALARYSAGLASLHQGGDPAAARKIWSPLGSLSGWWVIGPFDNERGGGFEREFGPETAQEAASREGRLYRADPDAAYPGKVRQVSWRKIPFEPLCGWVDLDALFRPNDETLAYALTHVESDAEQPAALRLGSDEGLKVWVNGQPVLTRHIRRERAFDQDAAGVRLRKGWNWILLKVTEEKGAWMFHARLTRPDGSPISGVREGSPPAGAAPGTSGEAGEVNCALGARERLEEAGRLESRSQYLLGALLHEIHPHDRGKHPDRELLRAAISSREGPVPAIYHYLFGLSCAGESEDTPDRDENAWREAMEAASSSSPPSLRATLDLARYYQDTFGNYIRSEQYLERVLNVREDHLEARLLLAAIQAGRGFPEGRVALEKEYLRSMASGFPRGIHPDLLRSAASRLLSEGHLEEGERALRELLSRNHLDYRSRVLLTRALLARGRPEEALSLLEEGARIAPLATGPYTERARILGGLDRSGEALAAIDEALRIAPEDHNILLLRGKALRRLGREEEALRTWERALAIQPNFPDLQEHVKFLKSHRDEFSERYRVDTGSIVAAALEAPAGGEDPVRVLLDFTAVKVNRDGTVKEFRQFVARAMNDRGVRVLDRHSTLYARGEQRVEFEAARVYRKDGRIEEARLKVFGGSPGKWEGWSRAVIDLPPVDVGDVIEVQHITEDLRPSFFGDYFGRRISFRSEFPISQETFILEAPEDRKLHFHQRNLSLVPEVRRNDPEGTVVYTWTRRNTEALRPEPGMPPREEIDPILEISTFSSWNAFATWYWNLIRHQYELSPQIRAKVEELTTGLSGEEEKIRAIYDFVTAEIRYNMWEFGVYGFKPYNADAIFTRRFGDCKDKATLLCTMLGAAGIQAYPVIIRATLDRGDEDLTMPMVNHFNHCIAYAPPSGNRQGMFLDGTAEHNALNEVPAMDRGARVLVVEKGDGQILQVPWNRPEELGLEEEVQAAIEKDRSARLQVRNRARGDYAAQIRSYFEVPGQRKTKLERMFGALFAGAAIEEEHFSDLANRSIPVEFQVSLRAPSFVSSTPEGEVIPVLDDFFQMARQFAELGDLEKRRFDLILGAPSRSALSVVYLLPEGYRIRALPESQVLSGRFGKLSLEFRQEDRDGRKIAVMKRVIEITAPRVSLADYPEFRELAATLARLQTEKIVIEKIQ